MVHNRTAETLPCELILKQQKMLYGRMVASIGIATPQPKARQHSFFGRKKFGKKNIVKKKNLVENLVGQFLGQKKF